MEHIHATKMQNVILITIVIVKMVTMETVSSAGVRMFNSVTYYYNYAIGLSSIIPFCKTSNNGHSDKRTTSLQWTNCLPPSINCPYISIYLRRRDNLRTMDKMLVPNMSIIRWFHCSTSYKKEKTY